jgi:hypothetical protein
MPPPAAAEWHPRDQVLVEALKNVFLERPIWTRAALCSKVPQHDASHLKSFLPVDSL